MASVERALGAPRRSGVQQILWLVLQAAAITGWLQVRSSVAAPQNDVVKAEAPADVADPNNNDDAAAKPDAAKQAQGYFLRVDLPISGDSDTKIRAAVTRLLGTLPAGGPRPVIVFELLAGQTEGGAGSQFSRALDLAKFIASPELGRVKTVAYIPKTIKGHAVLVAMACEEIIMGPDAEIGDAGINETVLGPTIRSGYKEISEARSTIPAAIALGMLDRNLKVFKVVTEKGTEYLLEDQIPELEKTHVIQSKEELRPKPLLVDGRRGRQELGFVSYLVDDDDRRAGVARALQLSPNSLQDNPALAGGWRPVQVNLKKPITPRDITIVQRKIDDQIRDRDVNFILLWIESDGGNYISSLALAAKLAQLDPSRIRTVAYVPTHARGDAALIALACDQIVMQPDAILGGEGADALKADRIPLAVKSLREAIKEDKSRSWSLSAAMVDPELKVYHYQQKGTGLVSYFCEEEVAQQPDPNSWMRGDLITSTKGPLQLTGRKAEEYGVATKLVKDFNEFKQYYGLEKDPGLVEPGWADHLISALASDGARMLLLIVGVMGIYLEINTPGVGIGSFVALLAFLLYFWAQHLQGTAEVLEVMLFLAGIICVALEIFVIPGFGIFGLGGGILIIASLILASQTFIIPANGYQLEQMRDTFLVLGGTAVGSVVLGAVMRRYLPHAPMFNRMMLAPPSAAELEALSHRESLVDFNHLLGRQGIATTPLILSGKGRFGDELADVISAGEPIDKGTQIVVIDVSGSRIVVEPVREA
jgi:membrane-bound serine protease (ClpP class)